MLRDQVLGILVSLSHSLVGFFKRLDFTIWSRHAHLFTDLVRNRVLHPVNVSFHNVFVGGLPLKLAKLVQVLIDLGRVDLRDVLYHRHVLELVFERIRLRMMLLAVEVLRVAELFAMRVEYRLRIRAFHLNGRTVRVREDTRAGQSVVYV